jgi:hypothetical protein
VVRPSFFRYPTVLLSQRWRDHLDNFVRRCLSNFFCLDSEFKIKRRFSFKTVHSILHRCNLDSMCIAGIQPLEFQQISGSGWPPASFCFYDPWIKAILRYGGEGLLPEWFFISTYFIILWFQKELDRCSGSLIISLQTVNQLLWCYISTSELIYSCFSRIKVHHFWHHSKI